MRGILIDPFEQTVTEVEYNGPYTEIYKWLSHETMPVDCFTVVQITDRDSIFVDDEGLLKDPTHFFIYEGYGQPLAGKGLILGCDDEGETVAAEIGLEEVKEKVSFRNDIQLSHMEEISGTVDHPIMGPDTPMFGSRPVFVKVEKESQ